MSRGATVGAVSVLALGLSACSGGGAVDSGVTSASTTGASVTATGGTTSATDSATASQSGSGTAATGSSGASSGTGSSTGSASGAKFDLGNPDVGGIDCECGTQTDFSYIWVANSSESTVSKINTDTMVEEGRYITRGDSSGNPSRTSVNLSGRAAVVANRAGGVVKIWARSEFCDPLKNGQPGVQTSTGSADVLAWDQDDCVAWYTDFPFTTQRAIAWAPGTFDQECSYVGEKVWTAGGGPDVGADATVHRLDGETGQVLDTVDAVGFTGGGSGPYGGAVDADGNFWFIHTGVGNLGFVDAKTLEWKVWDVPFEMWTYGIMVAADGGIIVSSSGQYGGGFVPGPGGARFDPGTETWELFGGEFFRSIGGVAQTEDGRIWIAQWGISGLPSGVRQVDPVTLDAGPYLEMTGTVKGVSVDHAGNVWAITNGPDAAHRIDPDTLLYDSYAGLSFPYTYSDMTGFGVQNVACKPAG